MKTSLGAGSEMLYCNIRAAGQIRCFPGRGACRHEVVPSKYQTGFAARASRARDPVCAVVRTCPRKPCACGTRRRAARRSHCVGACPASCSGCGRVLVHSLLGRSLEGALGWSFRSSWTGRRLSDLRSAGARQHHALGDAARTAGSSSRRVRLSDHQRRAGRRRLGRCSVSASRTARHLSDGRHRPVDASRLLSRHRATVATDLCIRRD